MATAVRQAWTAEKVEERLIEARDTLKRLPDRERSRLYNSQRCAWPDVVRDWADVWGEAVSAGKFRDMEPRSGAPSGAAIDRMDESLPWLGWLEQKIRQVVWARVNDASWWVVAGRARKSERTVQTWYRQGLETIAERLNRR